jgi:tRNA (guanine-N7-)-methyltransferase
MLDSYNRPQFYGRRRGRKLRPAQDAALNQGLSEYSITSPMLADPPVDPRQWFAPDIERICLEIGFGGGEHLAARAAQSRGTGFIGAEPFINGVASLCRHIAEQELNNIRIWPDDIRLLLPHLAKNTLQAVYILFPDPWPKQRHQARRILQPDMLDQLADHICPDGELLLASDDPTAKSWLLEYSLRHDRFVWQASSAADWRHPPADWPGTRYMRKAEKAGRKSAWFRFCRR